MTEKFKVLSDRDHVLLRPGMYIGSTEVEEQTGIINYEQRTVKVVPALIKMIEEIYQNSIDEYIRTKGKFANKIDIKIENAMVGTSITISDNGRGIPIKKIGEKYQPELAWTSLRAGSNFDNDGSRVTAGLNGVGSSLTNIFSSSFVGTTADGTNKFTLSCANNLSSSSFKITTSNKQFTEVKFDPDFTRFGVDTFDEDHMMVLRDRLENLAILYEGITFTLNGEKIKYKNLKQIGEKFGSDVILASNENAKLVIAPSGIDAEFRCLSYVNGIYVKNGGTHIDFVLSKIIDQLRVVIKRKHKIDVMPNAIRQHLLVATWIQGFKNLKFNSQTKEKITNPIGDSSEVFDGIDFDKIARQVVNCPGLIDPMIEAILHKKELAEAAELRKLNKNSDRANLRKITKFTDASTSNREKAILMICEGDSAAASILSARTPEIGCYPLRGKPINAVAANTKELLANKEFSELLSILGLKIGVPAIEGTLYKVGKNLVFDGDKIDGKLVDVQSGKHVELTRTSLDEYFKQSNVEHSGQVSFTTRFGKIASTTDADFDGQAISGLVFALFNQHWKELLVYGKVFRFNTPIMKVQQNKETVFFDTLVEFEEWAKKQKKVGNVRYLKGLGSSDSKDFKEYFRNMDTRLVKMQVNSPTDLDVFELLYSKDTGMSDKRKEWLNLE